METKNQTEVVTLCTPLLECAFPFNQKFRDYFSAVTGVSPFKFQCRYGNGMEKK